MSGLSLSDTPIIGIGRGVLVRLVFGLVQVSKGLHGGLTFVSCLRRGSRFSPKRYSPITYHDPSCVAASRSATFCVQLAGLRSWLRYGARRHLIICYLQRLEATWGAIPAEVLTRTASIVVNVSQNVAFYPSLQHPAGRLHTNAG